MRKHGPTNVREHVPVAFADRSAMSNFGKGSDVFNDSPAPIELRERPSVPGGFRGSGTFASEEKDFSSFLVFRFLKLSELPDLIKTERQDFVSEIVEFVSQNGAIPFFLVQDRNRLAGTGVQGAYNPQDAADIDARRVCVPFFECSHESPVYSDDTASGSSGDWGGEVPFEIQAPSAADDDRWMRNQIIRAKLPEKNASRAGVRRAWQLVDVEVYPAMRDSLDIQRPAIGLREKALRHKRIIVRPNVRKNEIKLVETIRFLIQTTANFSIESPESPPVIWQGSVFRRVE